MKIKLKKSYLLFLIFVLTLIFRLFFVFQTNTFSSDDAYFHLRHTEKIIENKLPIAYDQLSYGGRFFVYPPIFHYILAFFSIFIPFNLALKIIPEILISILPIVIYLISKRVSEDENASLIAALISAFIPLIILETLNKISVYSLALPVIFLMFYSFLRIKEKKFLILFIILSFILPLIHISSIIFVITALFYLILLFAEGKEINPIRSEAIIFSVLLIVLIEFLVYNRAFLAHGINFIGGNAPSALVKTYFTQFNIFEIIYYTGTVPLILGSFGIFYGAFKEKKRRVFLFSSIILSIILFLLFKLIDFTIAIMFSSLALTILSSLALAKFFKYIDVTKFHSKKIDITIGILALILIFSVIPSIFISRAVIENSFSSGEINVLEFIRDNTDEDVTVLANLEEGNLITAVAKRKNFIDKQFLLAPKLEQRLNDLYRMFTTASEAQALDLFKEYNINIIYLSTKSKKIFGINGLRYIKNEKCFEKIKERGKAEAYRVIC